MPLSLRKNSLTSLFKEHAPSCAAGVEPCIGPGPGLSLAGYQRPKQCLKLSLLTMIVNCVVIRHLWFYLGWGCSARERLTLVLVAGLACDLERGGNRIEVLEAQRAFVAGILVVQRTRFWWRKHMECASWASFIGNVLSQVQGAVAIVSSAQMCWRLPQLDKSCSLQGRDLDICLLEV